MTLVGFVTSIDLSPPSFRQDVSETVGMLWYAEAFFNCSIRSRASSAYQLSPKRRTKASSNAAFLVSLICSHASRISLGDVVLVVPCGEAGASADVGVAQNRQRSNVFGETNQKVAARRRTN